MARFARKSFRRFSLRTQVSSKGKIGLRSSRKLAKKSTLASKITNGSEKLRGTVPT